MSQSVLPIFSSKSFIVSGLTFRSLIYFEFIFVYGVRTCSNFVLLHVAVEFSQHHLLKRPSFLHCIFLLPLSNIRRPYVCGFISRPPILFHRFLFFVPAPYFFDYCSFVVQSEVQESDSSSSVFLSQDCFGYSRSFFFFPY